ncbi:amidohydrolase family protein [Candidatus Bipolaricaulota bacterium]
MILIQQISYLVRDADRVERNVDLLIDGNRIARIGDIDTTALPPETVVLSGRNRAVIPGLVNAHTHLYQSMLKGRRDDLPLVDWCDQVTFPFVRRVLHRVPQESETSIGKLWSMVGAIEMIRSGITSFIDMDMNIDGVIQAWCDVGIRGTAAMTMVDQWVPEDLMIPPEQTRENAIALIEAWHRPTVDDTLVSVFLAPSAPFTCSESLLTWIGEQSEHYDVGIETHISETAWEVEQSVAMTGHTPLAYLDKIGLLRRPLAAVHCVHLTDEEVNLALDRNVIVVYNAKSNMKLGSGIAPIVALHRTGVPIAIGTDGAASNDLLDPFEEMRTGLLLQKVAHQDPTVLGARDAFRFATEIGARACRSDAGMLDEGKLADVVLIDLTAPHIFRLSDEIVPALVYCAKASDVESVIINGRVVLRDRDIVTIDEPAVLDEAKKVGEQYGT